MTRLKEIICTVGVDLGGTNTRVAIVDAEGRMPASSNFNTRDYPRQQDFVERLAKEVDALFRILKEEGYTLRVKGIGIGAPCVDSRKRSIEGATNLPWKESFPLGRMLEEATGLPVAIANDANAAAIGEMTYGAARGMTDFIMLTLGTGVGSGIVCDGHLLSGKRGLAGELGHVTFPFASDRLCACGRKGCLQTVCASGGMVHTALELLATTTDPSPLRQPGGKLSARDIGKAVIAGDPVAKCVMRITEEALGRACAEFVALTDPEAIILFGGVANPEEMDAEHIRRVMDNYSLAIYRGRVKVLFSTLKGSQAALLGAASLPLHNPNL